MTAKWTFAAVAVAAVLAGGCASSDKPEANSAAAAETAGYRWAGQGEPASFGSAESFCRGIVSQTTAGNFPIGGGGAGALASGGGPLTVPGGSQSASPIGARSEVDTRRQLESCMRGQGWAKIEAAAPMPSGW